MLEDFKSKECERLTKVIADLEEEKNGIEEKYRKLAETETAAITSAIEAYKEMLGFWDSVNGEVVVKPKRKRRTKAEMEAARAAEQTELADDEKVVDEQEEDYVSEQELDNLRIQGLPVPTEFEEPENNDAKPEDIPFEEPIDNEVTLTPADEPVWEDEPKQEMVDGDDEDIWPPFPEDMK